MVQQVSFNKYNKFINCLTNKNHMNISIDAEEVFDKIQHVLLIKFLEKEGHEGIYLIIVNLDMTNPYSQHHPKWIKA